MKKLIIATLVSTLLVSGCQSQPTENTDSSENSPQNSDQPAEQTTTTKESAPKKVEIFQLQDNPQTPTTVTRKQAVIKNKKSILVKAEAGGIIEKVNFQKGDTISDQQTIATLGSSLSTDTQDINYQNSLTSLNNTKQQLAKTKAINNQTLENTKNSIEQAKTQLKSAQKAKTNSSTTTKLNLDQLKESKQNSYFTMIEHLRDTINTAHNINAQNPIDNGHYAYSNMRRQIRNLEDEVNRLNSRDYSPATLEKVLNDAEDLLSDLKLSLKEFSYNNFSENNSDRSDIRDDNNFPTTNENEYDRYNNNRRGYYTSSGKFIYFDRDDYEYYRDNYRSNRNAVIVPGTNETPYSKTDPKYQAQSQTIAGLTGQANQLLQLIQADKSALLQINQNSAKIQDGSISQTDNLQTQIELAEIQVKNAEQLYELRKSQNTLQELQLQAQVDQLQGQLKLAERNRNTKTISSPINGTITQILVEKGATINPGQSIAEVTPFEQSIITAQITPSEAKNLRIGDNIEITPPNNSTDDFTFNGTIAALPTTFSSSSQAGELEIIVSDIDIKSFNLKPGISLEIILPQPNTNNENRDSLMIPLKSVYFEKDTYVLIVNQSQATKQQITTGKIRGDMIEVTKGLINDDRIITTRTNIKDGDSIVVEQ